MMRLRLVLAVLVVSTLLVLPADAQTELDRARNDVASATEKLEGYLADLDATQRRGNDLAAQFWQVHSGLEKLDLDIAATQEISDEFAAQRSGLVDQVRAIALDQYVEQPDPFPGVNHAADADRAAAEALAEVVIGTDNSAIDQLAVLDAEQNETLVRLQNQREQQEEALAEVAATQASLDQELKNLAELRVSLDSELADLEQALEELEEVESRRQAEIVEAAEAERLAAERARAEAAAAAAAERARVLPTPTPVTPTPEPAPTANVVPTAVPNPQLPDPTATVVPTVVPNPQLPDPTATVVPNPQLPDPTATVVPNPQLPDPTATVVPNPQLPDPTATVVPNPQLPDPTATVVPNPQPSTPVVPAGGGAGGIVCPLAGPFTHTDDFNAPRAVGGVHRANDLISAQGTPVIAVASGTLTHKNSSVGGLSAHLKGDNGDYYFYTHLSGYENVGAGHVPAGTVIGYVGMTGNAPIPHLHFEIHSGGYGNYSNPYGPVRAACF